MNRIGILSADVNYLDPCAVEAQRKKEQAKMTDIVERLTQIADAKLGDPLPQCLRVPSNADGLGVSDWSTPMSALARDAIAEIMRLRTMVEQLRAVAGAVTVDGQSFADIKRDI